VRGIENVEHAKIRNGLSLFAGLLIDFDFKKMHFIPSRFVIK